MDCLAHVVHRSGYLDPNDSAKLKAAAVLLGHRGGLKGGPARMANLSPERRSEIASKGGAARAAKISHERCVEIGRKGAEARWGNASEMPKKPLQVERKSCR